MKNAICILIILVAASTALADYHYASHEGSNTYPYTSWATGAHLIQDAVDVAEGGDTVYVGSGDYYQRIFLHTDSLSLVGMGMDLTRIWYDLFGYCIVFIDSSALISRIEFEHTSNFKIIQPHIIARELIIDQCRFLGGAVTGADRGIIRNCIFEGDDAQIITGPSDRYLEAANCYFTLYDDSPINSSADTNIITNNIIRAYYGGGAGIRLTTGQVYDYIANNLVIIWGPTDGIYMGPRNEGLVLVNNTVDTLYRWQFEAWYGVYIFRDSVSVSIANNTITGGERAGVAFSGIDKTLYASYNNLWGNSQDFSVTPTSQIDTSFGILHEYPMFMDSGDYHLQAFSPLINAGDPAILDVDGSRSDIGFYGGPAGESYGYIDLPPNIPDSLSAAVVADSIIINWRYNPEADFNRYQLHRDTLSGFTPNIFNMIAEPDTSFYVDLDWMPGHNHYYKLAAVDNQDNISDYSEELEVILTSIWGDPGVTKPNITSITNSYPNPFNSQTAIVYFVADIGPIPAQINIDIYDIMGRKVRKLVDERKEVGQHTITWDGRNDGGSDCPSGVYFARISQWGEPRLSSKRKLVLLR